MPYRARPKSQWVENSNVEIDGLDGFTYVNQQYIGSALRKNISNLPPPSSDFMKPFNPETDQAALESLKINHLTKDLQNRVLELVKEYFPVFRPSGVSTPVLGYELAIDTGDHEPIQAKSCRYGMHEETYMQNHIQTLLENKYIEPDYDSPWSSRITLASKPHQEHVTDWNEYVWRFCVNYIRLNQITRPANYPIPRCDDATAAGYGNASFFILLDADSGYHQIRISKLSRPKTAFHGPYARKYQWCVMPFGLKNAPVIFVAFMHDLKEQWDFIVEKGGIELSNDDGNKIIIDDTFIFATTIDNAFSIARAICKISTKYQLTWKLKKAQFFPSSVEFVGVDISVKGNSPAQSKMNRISQFTKPKSPREIMAFLGFAIFYLSWLPWFEIRVEKMRKLSTQFPLDHLFSEKEFTKVHEKEWKDITSNILSKPILQRPSIYKRFYLKTDFSAKGLGFALCQPSNDPEAIAAMKREINGGKCEFELTLSNTKFRLRCVALGSRKCVGNEVHFHSFPGESLAAAWGIVKNRHYLWGKQFTLITDHRALMWLMDYKGTNHAVKRLQLEMNGYDFTIEHRPERMLEDANYMSRINQDKQIDPLLKDYVTMANELYSDHKPPTDEEVQPENMPGRRPVKKAKSIDTSQGIMGEETQVNLALVDLSDSFTVIEEKKSEENNPLQSGLIEGIRNIPFKLESQSSIQSASDLPNKNHTELASQFKAFQWCIFEPKFGHFMDVAKSTATNFNIAVGIESNAECRNQLQKEWKTPIIFNNGDEFMNKWTLKEAQKLRLDGYYASLKETFGRSASEMDLTTQVKIIATLRTKSNISVFVVEIRSPQINVINSFISSMREKDWTVQSSTVSSSEHFSDAVNQECVIITGINNHATQGMDDVSLIPLQPPPIYRGMTPHLNQDFDKFDHALASINDAFEIHPIAHSVRQQKPTVTHILRPRNSNNLVEKGYEVFDVHSPAPAPSTNQLGLFHRLFGIQFSCVTPDHKTASFIRAISISEYVATFGFSKKFNNSIIKYNNCIEQLCQTIPCRMMSAIIISAHKVLTQILQRRSKRTLYDLNGMSSHNVLNGIVPSEIPNDESWIKSYMNDQEMNLLKNLVTNPSTIDENELSKVHYFYRQPLRDSRIKWEDDRIILLEPIAESTECAKLIIVPKDLRKCIFTCFHVNPLGGHYSLYYTMHRIRIRYHWPEMYKDLKFWISTCAACLLKNKASKPASELLYTFPLDEPMSTIHVDAYVPGKTESIAGGEEGLIVSVDHMTGFVAGTEYYEANGKEFARAVYKSMLRYGLAAIIVTDADSKFGKEFDDMCNILKVKHITAARGHHDTIIVERFNRFLNSALIIFCSDRDSMRVFIEGALTAMYAWNSAPVAGTDLSRSLLVTGREFKFPIDFQNRRHITTTSSESDITSFADVTLELMAKCREVFKTLIDEHRTLHRELRNAQLLHPRKFKKGDIVFTKVQVQSNKRRGKSGKLTYSRRGPYRIVEVCKGGSYMLRKIDATSKSIIKKHGNTLSMCPQELHPFPSVEGSDKKFADLDKPVVPNPYYHLGLKSFETAKPWAAAAAPIIAESKIQDHTSGDGYHSSTHLTLQNQQLQFPTVEELDFEYESSQITQDDVSSSSPSHTQENQQDSNRYSTNSDKTWPGETNIVLISHPNSQSVSSSDLGTALRSLLNSKDKLYFIAYHWPNCTRREWKLVQINFIESTRKNPECFQNGRFLADFYICHPNDINFASPEQRYWLEYHKIIKQKQLHRGYHLIKPSFASQQMATDKRLVPFRDWIVITDPTIILHGPFNFDHRQGRPTRDLINTDEWKVLIAKNHLYDNDSPTFEASVNMTIPIKEYEISHHIKDDVTMRVSGFSTNMEYLDQKLEDYYSL